MIRQNLIAIAVFALLVTASVAQATLPVVDRLSPMGVVRGTETTVTFHGTRVSDAYDVLCLSLIHI